MDNIEHINWCGYTWLTRERWGSWHSGKPWNWYDMNCIRVKDDILYLSVQKNPRVFNDGYNVVMSPYGIGLVSSLDEFGFGYFEIEARLPVGDGLWPAFWMYPPEHWPHEIDIFEAYSKKNNYRECWLKPWAIESCIHREEGLGLIHVLSRAPWRWEFNNDPSKNFNRYGCMWTQKEITWLINDKIIRRVRNYSLCEYMSKYKMHVIINTHIDGKFVDDFKCSENMTPFMIRYFRYTML